MILQRIKELCEGKNISINALEVKLGYGKGTISGWEKASPTTAKLIPVAEYFNVSLDYLARGKEHGANIT